MSNSYRDAMIDRICWEAFGITNPSRTQVIDKYGFLLSKGTQGRADISRSLRQQVGELVENTDLRFYLALSWSVPVPPRRMAKARLRGQLRPQVLERGPLARQATHYHLMQG